MAEENEIFSPLDIKYFQEKPTLMEKPSIPQFDPGNTKQNKE